MKTNWKSLAFAGLVAVGCLALGAAPARAQAVSLGYSGPGVSVGVTAGCAWLLRRRGCRWGLPRLSGRGSGPGRGRRCCAGDRTSARDLSPADLLRPQAVLWAQVLRTVASSLPSVVSAVGSCHEPTLESRLQPAFKKPKSE